MILSIRQTQALDILEDQTTNELLFGGGAGGGKSVLGCYWELKNCFKYPGSRWLLGRAVAKTLKDTTLNTMFGVMKEQGVKNFNYNTQRSIITFPNESQILLKDLQLYPSDPNFDELGSLEITGGFVDEVNQIVSKAWGISKSRIRYRLNFYCHVCGNMEKSDVVKDDQGRDLVWICGKGHKTEGLIPKMLGTCNPAKNWTYNDFYSPSKNGTLPKTKQFIQSLVSDNPNIDKNYRNNLLQLDKASKERLLYGNWEYDDDPSILCSYDAISDVFRNDHVKGTGKKYASADLAMQGRDKFIAGAWDGLVCTVKIEKAKSTGKEIEQDLRQLIDDERIGRSNVIADSDGLGSYLESYLNGIKEFHGNARAENDVEYQNLKSECAFKLAEVINKREIRIVCTDEQKQFIMEELGCLKRDKIDADDQRKRIIKKDAMKELLQRSPDYLDMLLMRMYFEVKKEMFGI